jgi:hypothetical protein
MKNYGQQVACLTYFGNWRARVAEWRARGFVAILDAGCVRIHQSR